MTEIRLIGAGEFRALGRRLGRTAEGKQLRRNLTRRLRAETDVVVQDVKSAVQSVQSKGVRGGGRRQRQGAHDAHRSAQAEARAAARARAGKAPVQRRPRKSRVQAHGLRAAIARGVKVRVKYSGYTTGVRVYVDKRTLPESQQKLPRLLNNPAGWRHPVFGSRDADWVRQTGQEYWGNTIRRHKARIQQAVAQAVADTIRSI